MRKVTSILFIFLSLVFSYTAHAMLSLELTQGQAGAIPIAVASFAKSGSTPQNVSEIISNDLQNSGRFKVVSGNALSESPSEAAQVSSDYFRRLGTDNVVVGKILSLGGDRYEVSFQLIDMFKGAGNAGVVLSKKLTIPGREMRAASHHISDLIYQHITGVRGVFSTKLAYVLVQRAGSGMPSRYVLEVSDQDGYNPRSILTSSEPIMSPSWSPNGRQIAYVSFENKRAGIYIHDVASGGRRLLSSFPGINGAPAWSPDGRRLALVLSKSGSPNIYVMDVGSRQLTQVTNDFYINTEPSWSPDGRSIIFTSNRSGGPQIYQVSSRGGEASRISFDGDYNARGSYTPDGAHISMIHRVSGIYKIAILDLDSGTTRVLTNTSSDSASPSIAPNGSMLIYDTIASGRNVLGMVSADGRVQLTLPARNGEAQDPAWSPFS